MNTRLLVDELTIDYSKLSISQNRRQQSSCREQGDACEVCFHCDGELVRLAECEE